MKDIIWELIIGLMKSPLILILFILGIIYIIIEIRKKTRKK